MADNQQEQDRSEPATPFKLREAKKRGQAAKSMEINSLVILSVAFALLSFMGLKLGEQVLELCRALLNTAHLFDGSRESSATLYEHVVHGIINIFWPVVGSIVVAGILANVFQTGPIFSTFPLKPDFKRLNPVAGFKRVFSKKMLIEAFKSILKILFFGLVIYFTIQSILPKILTLGSVHIEAFPVELNQNIRTLFGRLLVVVLIVAIIDLAYSRWDFAKRMKMSRREIKEEVKRREGDPLVRAKLRQLQREAVKRAASIQNIPDADILITNPTHLSVAIQYDRNTMLAPEVVAKGAGELALRMRQLARKHNVTIVENKKVAQHLFKKVGLAEPVPADMFPVIAKMLAWVYMQKQSRNHG